MNPYLAFILAALMLGWLLDVTATTLNMRAMRPEPPKEFAGAVDASSYARTIRYLKALSRLDLVQDSISTLALTAFILLGGFGFFDQASRSLGLSAIPTGVVYLLGLGLLADLFGTPFSIYRTFVIEERFGFNRTRPALFIADKLKGLALGGVIGGALAAAVLFFFGRFGGMAWVYAWVAVSLFIAALQYLAPSLILPLFNKFSPLPEGELRGKLEAYAASQNMPLSGIFVMDGSKRTSKANAFFTGFGAKKRISLYDTLVEKMDPRQITAVLAHEVGHARLGHMKKGLAAAILQTGALLFLFSLFLSSPGLYAACGVAEMSVHAGLALFLLIFQPAALVLSLLTNAISRRHEYAADAFAAKTMGDPEALASALVVLSASNASNLTPHPLHVFLRYGHPPVLERIQALRALGAR